jgi:hypothetical protein
MISMRYGAVPVARRTGCLAETVDAQTPARNGPPKDGIHVRRVQPVGPRRRSGPRALRVRLTRQVAKKGRLSTLNCWSEESKGRRSRERRPFPSILCGLLRSKV